MGKKQKAHKVKEQPQPCIFCGAKETEFHLELWMCKDCEKAVAKGFEGG